VKKAATSVQPPDSDDGGAPANGEERSRYRWSEMSVAERIEASPLGQRAVAKTMHLLFETSRFFGRRRASRFIGGIARIFGPLTREHRIARDNLAAVFPEKSESERRRILKEAWEHVARATVEYAFLDDLVAAFDPAQPTGGVVEIVGLDHIYRLRDSGKPGVIFGAHIGNWELTAAIGAKLGVPVTALYRPPANPFVAEEIQRRRSRYVGKLVVSGRGAALNVAAALRRGEHVGIIVDQRINEGPRIPFLGQPSRSNPLVGVLARLFDCPVHGAWAVRLPDGRFRVELTPPLDLPRDGKGRVDSEAANLMVHGTVEDWVRKNPEQWLWMHDRWRRRRRRWPRRGHDNGGTGD
jgi:Kdo2-lipid IVA lauroyltransferase/acyltransferase